MSWLDKLKEITGEAAGATAHVAGQGLHDVNAAMQWSAEHGKEWQGDLDYYLSRATHGLPGAGLIPGPSASDILRYHDQGFNGYTGGRAVWEQMQSDNPLLVRGVMDVLNPTDPINTAGWISGAGPVREGLMEIPTIGKLLRGANGYREASPISQALGYGVEGIGRGVQGVIRGQELPGDVIGWGTRGLYRSTLGKVIQPGKQAMFNRDWYKYLSGLAEVKQAEHLPTQTDFTNISTDLPWRSGNLPVNQVLDKKAEGPLAAIRARFPRQRSPEAVGIIPEGGFPRNALLTGLEDQDVQNAADVAAAHMAAIHSEVSGRPTGALEYAAGMRDVRKTLRQRFGEGIEPVFGAIFNRARNAHPELPKLDPRFDTEQGFAEGGRAIDVGLGKAGGLEQAAADFGAGHTIINRVSGDSAAPFAQGGELYNVAKSATGKSVNIEPPEQFINMLEQATAGPADIMYGEMQNGVFIPAKQGAKEFLDNLFGMPIDNAVYEREIWPKIVQRVYEGNLEAAQQKEVSITAAAKRYLGMAAGKAKPKTKLSQFSSGLSSGDKQLDDSIAAVFERGRTLVEGGAIPSDQTYIEAGDFARSPYGRPYLNVPDPTGMVENATGVLMPNASALMDYIARGGEIDLKGRAAREWYEAAFDEVRSAFGPGRLDDINLFLDLIGSTSAHTGPHDNARLALEAFTAIKAGEPGYLKELGFTDEEIAKIPKVIASRRQVLGKDHAESVAKATGRYQSTEPVFNRGGQKQTSYVTSFLLPGQKGLVSESGLTPELTREIHEGIDRSAAVAAMDRHSGGRLFGLNINPNDSTYQALQSALVEVSKEMGLVPHQAQAGSWYWTKGAQGYSASYLNDSIGEAVKRFVESVPEGKLIGKSDIDRLVRHTIDNMIAGKNIKAGTLTEGRITSIAKSLTKDVLPAIKAGERDGGTFEFFDPKQAEGIAEDATTNVAAGFRDISDNMGTSGFAVGVAGMPIISADAKPYEFTNGIRNTLRTFRTAIESGFGDKIKLGVYHSPEKNGISFDLSLIVPDRRAAIQLAKKTNQESIWDIGKKELVMTGGSGNSPIVNSEQFMDILKGVYGGEEPVVSADSLHFARPSSSAEQKLQGGIEFVKNKIGMDYLGDHVKNLEDSLAVAKRKKLQEADINDLIDTAEQLHPTDTRPISEGAKRTLHENTFTTGKYAGRTWNDVTEELKQIYANGMFHYKQAGSKIAPDATLQTKLDLFKNQNVKKMLKDFDKIGLDPENTNPYDAVAHKMQELILAEHALDPSKMSKYKVLQSAWGQQALISPRYHGSNILGAWMQQLMGGHGIMDTMNPMQYWRTIKASLAGEGRDLTGKNLSLTKFSEKLQHWGYAQTPGELTRTQSLHGATGQSSKNSLGRVAKKVIGQKAGGFVGKIADINQAIASAWETNIRSSLFADMLDHHMNKAMVPIQDELEKMGAKRGIDIAQTFDFTTGKGLRGDDGVLSLKALQTDLEKSGLTSGESNRIVNLFTGARSKGEELAMKEVDRIHFSYEFTNLDEAISKVIPFHYWASRALRFYAEETLRHPVYLYQYAKLREGLDRAIADPGNSARSKGFMQLMDSPYGFSLLMNPESLFGAVKMFDLDNGITPTGETHLGKALRIGKQHGVGLFPWVDATLNYMGAYGDTFAPDPAGLRTRQLVGAAVNYGRSKFGMEPAPAPYESANVKLRSWISSLSSSLEPSWFSQVAEKSSADGTLGRATLDDVIVSRITAENPNLTNQEVLDILNNPDSPEYDKAYREAAEAGLIQQIMNFTIPATFKVKEASRDVERAQLNTIRKAAKDAGVRPEDYTPTIADANFLTTYKNQTGKDFKPGDYSASQLKRDLAVAPPQARPFIIQEAEYSSVGTPEGQAAIQKANDIRAGKYTPTELAGQTLTPDERDMVADIWLQRNGGPGVEITRGEQKLYRDTHPEFDSFKSWQGQMFNITAAYGPDGWAHYREVVSQNNPNAAKYFDDKRREIISRNPTATPQEIATMLDSATISPAAWYAVTGQSSSQYDPAPMATGTSPYGDPATAAALSNNQFQLPGSQGLPPGPPKVPDYHPNFYQAPQTGGWMNVLRQRTG